MCNKADNSCRQEKLGCKGCFYNIYNDEEKKAIEILEAVGIKCDGIDVYKTIKNLIQKQQKEIKDLKEKNEILTNITYLYNSYEVNNENKIIVADKEYFDSGLFVKRYISKDKIKEKLINDIKGINEKLHNKEYINIYRTYRLKGMKTKCKELLEFLESEED